MDRFPHSQDTIVQRAGTGLQTYMAQVYGWMTCGLLLTAFISGTPPIRQRSWSWYSLTASPSSD